MRNLKYTPEKCNETCWNKNGEVEYITFPALDKFPEIKAAFSTKLGGVSSGMFESMNLGRFEMDSMENITENYKRFCSGIGIDVKSIVISDQQHTDNIKIVGADDRGKGLFKERDYESIDGFITNEKNVALCLLFADCVPVYIYDPENKVIALVHSGWKGTALNIPARAVRLMEEKYGSRAENMTAVIAPSICQSCYEVSGDLYDAFSEKFSDPQLKEIFHENKDGKYQLDLWLANRIILQGAGLLNENIHTTDLCTSCNKDVLFSHRASKGRRGNLAAVFMLK